MKNLFTKYKRILICLTVALTFGFIGGQGYMPQEEYNTLLVQQEQLDKQLQEVDTTLENSKKDVATLQAKKQEKERIAQANLEKENKAKEEAKKKAEAEKKSQEEAKKKADEQKKAQAEAEQKAKEEADRIAKAEAAQQAQQQENTNNYQQNTTNNSSSVDTTTPVGEMVWLTATGSKYHRKNNCGNTNTANARQVSLNDAQSQGFSACKKCY